MCMLHIMLWLEKFPVESLALLSHEVTRRLFLGLSHANFLHIDVEMLFGDLHPDPSMDPSNCRRGPAFARKALLDVILCGDPSQFVSLNMKPVLDCFDHYETISSPIIYLFEHVSECYPSLEPTVVLLYFKHNVILPKQFLQFVNLECEPGSVLCKLQVPRLHVQLGLCFTILQHAVCPEWAQGWLLRLSNNNVLEGLPGSPLEKCSNH